MFNFRKLDWQNLFAVALLLSPSCLYAVQTGFADASRESLLLAVVALTGWAALLGRRYWALGLLPLALLSPLEFWYIFQYGRPSDASMLGVLFESNHLEIGDYLNGLPSVLLILTLLGSGFYIGAAYFLLRSPINWAWSRRVLAGGLAFICLAMTYGLIQYGADEFDIHQDSRKIFSPSALISSPQSWDIGKAWPVGLPFRLKQYISERARAAAEKIGERSIGELIIEHKKPLTILFVIGETSRPHNWQLAGYSRLTNPRLAQRKGVYFLPNVRTPWSYTRSSLTAILAGDAMAPMRQDGFPISFVEVARRGAYTTHWFSNQQANGEHDSTGGTFARAAQQREFLNPVSYREKGAFDGVLLAAFKRGLSQDQHDRRLFVLHTLGSHFNYADRVPPTFDVFKPTIRNNAAASIHNTQYRTQMVNSYDNSILYTDWLLDELIESLVRTQQPSAMFFVSDHGEGLFDAGCGLGGHGHNTDYDLRSAAMFWLSDQFVQQQPQLSQYLMRSAQQAASTTQFASTIMKMAGLQHGQFSAEQMLFKPITAQEKQLVTMQVGEGHGKSGRSGQCHP